MNLKKTAISLFAAMAMTLTLAAPMASAQIQQTSQATVNEDGSFSYQMTFASMSFSAVDVTSTEGATVRASRGNVQFTDTHSYNPTGWKIAISSGNLETLDEAHFISNENLSVWERSAPGCAYAATYPVVGNNGYQTLSTHLPGGPGGPGVPLSVQQDVVSASSGRGCGTSNVGLYYSLNVPAGTYTGNGTAIYYGSFTLTNTMEAGDSN
jgi:hypothetical protein